VAGKAQHKAQSTKHKALQEIGTGGKEPEQECENPDDFDNRRDLVGAGVPPRGFELPANSPGKASAAAKGGAECGARAIPGNRAPALDDLAQAIGADLQTVIKAWPTLPGTVRAKILSQVRGGRLSSK
jgi:hypothetical protein